MTITDPRAALLAAGDDIAALRWVIYGRNSKDRKVSIGQQMAHGVTRAGDNGGTIVARLTDGESASRYATGARDDWAALLALVEAGAADVVWLWETSRGDRRPSTWHAFIEACEDRGVLIYVESYHRALDPRLSRDKRTLGEDGVENGYESDKIHERTMRAKDAARFGLDGDAPNLRTLYGGRPPLGWMYRKGDADWTADPVITPVMRDVAARMLAGASFAEAMDAQPAGVRDHAGRAVSAERIRDALHRPVTAGLITTAASAEARKRHQADPDAEIVGAVPQEAPLDEATWRRLSARFRKARRGRTPSGRYPFGPVLRCSVCGSVLVGGARGGERFYQCKPGRHVSVRAEDVERLIMTAVESYAARSPRYAQAVNATGKLDGRRAELAAAKAAAKLAMSDTLDLLRGGLIERAEFTRHRDEITAEIAALDAEAASLDDAEANPLPAVIDWPVMPQAQVTRLVSEVLETPIVVLPGTGGPKGLTAAQRVELHARKI